MPETIDQKAANKDSLSRRQIPKSREFFRGDINHAVIEVQKSTGIEIDEPWWMAHVGNDGGTESILDKFDEAYGGLVDQKAAEEQQLHPEYDEKVIRDMFDKKQAEDIKAEEKVGIAKITYLDQEPSSELKSALHAGLEAIETRLGPELAGRVLGGLEVVVGDNLKAEDDKPLKGGRAFPALRLVVLDRQGSLMSVGEMEDLLTKPNAEGEIFYAAGELSELGADKLGGEVTLVHEVGHIFDALVHEGHFGGDNSVFVGEGAPTKYGAKSSNEDYAESFLYYILKPDSPRLSPERKAAIEKDIELVRQQIENETPSPNLIDF